MIPTINETTKLSIIHNGTAMKRTTRVRFGWIVEIVRAGEIVRRFECATMEEARRCE